MFKEETGQKFTIAQAFKNERIGKLERLEEVVVAAEYKAAKFNECDQNRSET